MLIDTSERVPNGSFEADICIVGTGPAGVVVALELAKSGLRICLLESGGQKPETGPADLNTGSVDSAHHYPAEIVRDGRRRQLGGSANLWNHQKYGGRGKMIRYVPLDEIDFERRDWVPMSGWPFSRSDLAPFYRRAHRVCGIGPFDWSAGDWQSKSRTSQLWQTKRIETVISQFGTADVFLKDHLEKLEKTANVFIFAHASLLSLNRNPRQPDAISTAEVVRSDGRRFKVKASKFVLAAGGLENARILLLNEATRNGAVGNRYDMVGRCFMDHPSITLGTLVPSSGAIYHQAAFYDQQEIDGQPIMGKLHLRQDVLRQEKLLNACAVLVPRLRSIRSNLPGLLKQIAIKVPRRLFRQAEQSVSAHAGPGLPPSLHRRLLDDFYSECRCGWSSLSGLDRRFSEIAVRSLVEQSPDPANRIVLGDQLDALGQPRCKVIWRWNEIDLLSIRRTQEIFRHELALAGIGTFTPVPESVGDAPRLFFSPHHFLGCTRMHENPRQGVVDADCRVHGLQNLYVVGGSVFPTGGYANPTLTIVALALRLSDHLRKDRSTVSQVGSGAETKALTRIAFARDDERRA